MFVPRGLEMGGDAAAQMEERRRAQLETRNDALRFLLVPVALELGMQWFIMFITYKIKFDSS